MSYTPPKYPSEIPTYVDIWPYVDDKDWMNQNCWDALVKELRACLIELGTLPKGAYADVKTRLNALEAGLIPSGLIAIWHGLLSNIPSGWVICDGNNGTPNLLDKFVKGVPTAATNPGGTGGAASVILTNDQIPNHQHSISNDGEHHHHLKKGEDLESGPNTYGVNGTTDVDTSSAGIHAHGGNTGAIGGGQSHENRPPYYEVAFIMKT